MIRRRKLLGITRTIRLDEDLDDQLQKAAKDERVTVNAVVSRAVRRYIEWDKPSQRFGVMTISPEMLSILMERQSVEEARELGIQTAKNLMRPAIESMFVDFDLTSSVELLRRFSVYGARYQFEHKVNGRKHIIVLRHGLGARWSSFYEGLLEWTFEELGIEIKVTAHPHVCTGKFELDH